MSDLIGLISRVEDFMKKDNTSIKMRINNERESVLNLAANRVYVIPSYQREIRWKKENLYKLVTDISKKPIFLGNIILSEKVGTSTMKKYDIIDGQQRITMFIMLIKFLNGKLGRFINHCGFENENFYEFYDYMECDFDLSKSNDPLKIIHSDVLNQRDRYKLLWDSIEKSGVISTPQSIASFAENFCNCNINVILNTSQIANFGIQYFIDVNLKGIRLDKEDIFKGYLFKFNRFDAEIKSGWVRLKENSVELNTKINSIINKTQMIDFEKECVYPLVNMLEHFFICDLYKNETYKHLKFDGDFLISEIEIDGDKLYDGTHLIEAVNKPKYFIDSLNKLAEILEFMLDIVDSRGVTNKFSDRYKKFELDDKEIQIIYELIRSLILDKHILIKALLMKYILTILDLDKENNSLKHKKKSAKLIYGVFVLSILFILYENKKGKEQFITLLKSNNWNQYIIKEINSYLDPAQLTSSQINKSYRFNSETEEGEENEQFRAKSLALIFNFLHKIPSNDGVSNCDFIDMRPNCGNKFFNYIVNKSEYSVEHYIIPKSGKLKMENGFKYDLPKSIKTYKNKIFNFIFISESLNSKMSDLIILEKNKIMASELNLIHCEYSKMSIQTISEVLIPKIEIKLNEVNRQNDFKLVLDDFFNNEFKELYLEYCKIMLQKIQDKFLS